MTNISETVRKSANSRKIQSLTETRAAFQYCSLSDLGPADRVFQNCCKRQNMKQVICIQLFLISFTRCESPVLSLRGFGYEGPMCAKSKRSLRRFRLSSTDQLPWVVGVQKVLSVSLLINVLLLTKKFLQTRQVLRPTEHNQLSHDISQIISICLTDNRFHFLALRSKAYCTMFVSFWH